MEHNRFIRTLLLTSVMAVIALFQINHAQAAVCAPPQIDLCANAPADQADHCRTLASYLADFQQEVCSVEMADANYTPNYAGVVSLANGNIGPALLTTGSVDRAALEMDYLAALGAKVIRLDIVYPMLTPNFHTFLASQTSGYDDTADEYVAFYRGVVAAARARGLQVHIEHSTTMPSHASLNPRPYFAEIKALGGDAARERFRQERATEARLLLTELAPDYLTVMTEPDTDNASFGKLDGKWLYTPAEWQAYVEYTISQFPAHNTKLGAGAGTWDSDEYMQRLAALPILDYIDLHVYPARSTMRNYLSDILRWSDLVRSIDPTKGITIGEAWLYKADANEISSLSLNQSEILGRDVYGYWEPLDAEFIKLLDQAARAKQIEVLTPFWSRHFYAYLDYGKTSSQPPAVRMHDATMTGFRQMQTGALTATGRAFRDLALATNPLVIGSIEPNHGPQTGPNATQSVILRGANFMVGTTPTVLFGDVAATGVEVIDANTLRAVVPAGSGSVTVTVNSADGRVATKPNAYTYDAPPTISTLSVTEGPDAGGTFVVVDGSNFSTGDTPAQILFGDLPATEVTVYGPKITARTPAAPERGLVDVTVVNADGQRATLAGGFRFLSKPQIHALSVTNGPSSGGTLVTISGKHFMPDRPGTRVLFGGGEATAVTVLDAATLQAVTPAGMGTITVTLINPGGQYVQAAKAFSYDFAPVVVEVIPSEGKGTGGNDVWIGGARFDPNAQVFFGDQPAIIQTRNNNVLKVTAPAGSGSTTIKVVNPDGQLAQAPRPYVYQGTPAPTVLYFTPGYVPQEGGAKVYIYGQNFRARATVHFGGKQAKNVLVLSDQWILATAPAGAGDAPVRVTNPDGKQAISMQPLVYANADGVVGTAPDDPLGIGEDLQLPVSKIYLPTLER